MNALPEYLRFFVTLTAVLDPFLAIPIFIGVTATRDDRSTRRLANVVTLTVFCDVVTRTLGAPWLWLQQVTTAFFAWGVFLGMAAATRRNDHFYLTEITKRMTGAPRSAIELANRVIVLVVALLLIWFGWKNALLDLGSYRMPSLIPLTVYTAIVPAAGVLIALFTIEQLVNGWRHGFEGPEDRDELPQAVVEEIE